MTATSDSIEYNVPLIRQGLQDCLQASVAQLMAYHDISKTIEELKQEVPVYKDERGVPVGTSIGHMAAYLCNLGFAVTIHSTDIQLFDPSWRDKPSDELIDLLRKRLPHLGHPTYSLQVKEAILEGYSAFLQAGGTIEFPVISKDVICNVLEQGPLLAVVSYNFLNGTAKTIFDAQTNLYVANPIEGQPSTHAVVVAGYKDDQFLLVDPDQKLGGKRWLDANRVVGAVYLAQTDFDNMIISVQIK